VGTEHRRPVDGPLVVLDVEYVRRTFVLVLHNAGHEVAFRPRVRFSQELVGVAGRAVVSDLPLWATLTLLAPGRRIEVLLDAANLVLSRGEESTRFTASVSYTDADGNDFLHTYDHDLTAYRGLPQLEP